MSTYLDRRQLRGLDKLGDVFLPGVDGVGDGGSRPLPSFSASGCAEDIDSVLAYLPDGDRGDLSLLLTILGWLPRLLVRAFVWLTERAGALPGPVGALLRFARIGTRGLVMCLYWAHPPVLAAIDYEVGVVIDDDTVRA
jgi:hypothetical protein